MSEGTHSTPTASFSPGRKTPQKKHRFTLFLVGTVAAILIAAVAFQAFRAEQAVTGEESRNQQPSKAGRASLSGSKSRPVARVNSQYITYELVARECFDRYGKEMLENIINRTIIQQACTQRGIVVTEAEVDAEILQISKRLSLDVKSWYEFLQVERGVTPTEVRRDRIWPILALKKLAGEKIEVTQEDMDKGYIRLYGPRVEARMIMFGNIRRAQEVLTLAKKNPDDFPRLAQEHSIDRNSAAMGGVIPPIHRYGSSKNLEDEAFRLKDGEISAIVHVGIGQHVILKREGKTDPKIPMEEVRETLYDQILEEKIQEAVASVFEKIRKGSRVDNYLTNTSTGIRRVSGPGDTGRVRNASGSQPVGTQVPRRTN